MAYTIRRLPRPWNWAAARRPRPYSSLTRQVPLTTRLAMVNHRSWMHVLSIISRGCVWDIDVWVLSALLQRLKGWGGQPVCAQTIHRTLHQIGLHGCRPRRKPLLKMMHKKARKQFAEDKQTKNMDYWNHVLWSDETRINFFGSDGVKRVWWQPGEEYKDKCVLPTVKHGGGSVMVWGCMSTAGTGELQFIHTVLQDDHCLVKEAEGKGNLWGILKRKVEERKVSNIHQLCNVIMEEWKRTPVAICGALVNSMLKRVKAVLE